MHRKSAKILFILFLSIFSLDAYSQLSFSDGVFPELAVSGRALAMGNAYIAKVDDAASVFYNPAGLGTRRRTTFHLSNIHIDVNKGWMRAAAGGSISRVFTSLPNAFSLDGIREDLLDTQDEVANARFQAMPNFTTRYFSAGYLYSIRKKATYASAAGSQFEYADRRDHGPYASLNLSMFGGVFKIGATGILLNRSEAFGTSDPNTAINLQDSDKNSGSGLFINAGAKLTFPITLLPTFAVNMHNVTSSTFTASSGAAAAPAAIASQIDLGFSITPQIGKTTRLHLEVNYKDFTSQVAGVSTARKITAGMEIDFSRRIFLRFGYGDGFGSAGLGMKTQNLEFDMTTYAVDTTSSSFRGREDRRIAITISSGF